MMDAIGAVKREERKNGMLEITDHVENVIEVRMVNHACGPNDAVNLDETRERPEFKGFVCQSIGVVCVDRSNSPIVMSLWTRQR